jgi:hypothetical protein
MSRRSACVALLSCLAGVAAPRSELCAQGLPDTARVSFIYTGRSLGALGVRRWQVEHELLTEQANAENVPFKLVSHMAWRAPGIVIFMSGQEPEGNELPDILARRATAERIDTVHALSSANVLLFQDPWRPTPDLTAMLQRNPRMTRDFPDLVPVTVSVSRLRASGDERVYIVEGPGAVWPTDTSGWTTGDMNRVDLADSRMFELPLNLGQFGPRATVVQRVKRDLLRTGHSIITADLGHAQGDLGMADSKRARLDFAALGALDYSVIVPYEAELSLGVAALDSVRATQPEIVTLGSNVHGGPTGLMMPRLIVTSGRLKIGLVGLVSPRLADRLPRKILSQYTFEPPDVAAKREVSKLRDAGADAVIVLSNMDPAENAAVAERVDGIDAIVADLPVRWSPEVIHQRVELPDRPYARLGSPALIARSAANGVAVGRLTLEFHTRTVGSEQRLFLAALEHHLDPVTDRTPPDTNLVRRIAAMAAPVSRERGDLMFPAFVDLATRHPNLRDFDETTKQGRASQPLWESFMARLLRRRAHAEVAVIRRLDQFPPLIGKLHENEIDAWLWTEDQIVVMDVRGSALRALLNGDVRRELATSGINLAAGTVQGHKLDDNVYYRVATVDLLRDGARNLGAGRRVRDRFVIGTDGDLVADRTGASISLRNLVLGELKRVRVEAKGDDFIDRVAELMSPGAPFVRLTYFTFDRPTLYVSANSVQGRDGYGSVSESRVTSADAWVVGAATHLVLTNERMRSGTDWGLTMAYGRQGVTSGSAPQVGESSDDLKWDVTLRPSFRSAKPGAFRPFARGLFDTEFTPTRDPVTTARNPRQMALRASSGWLMLARPRLRRAEFALAVENDFGRPNVQFGLQALSDWQQPVGIVNRLGIAPATYRFRNEATYFLPAPHDGPSSLALKFNMIHELIIPLLDELSLSVAADIVAFQGKTDANRHLAVSSLLRVGITYDRQWKPRYQPFW